MTASLRSLATAPLLASSLTAATETLVAPRALIADGRIAANWHVEDNLTLLRQLGAVPTP